MNGNKPPQFNPFQPDEPVSPELFVGRKPELTVIENAIAATVTGRGKNILIHGDKGIGKTSIANFVGYLASGADTGDKYGGRLFVIFTSLGGCEDVEDVTISILEEAYKSIRSSSIEIIKKTKNFFKSLSSFGLNIGLFGLSMSREKTEETKLSLKFHNVITELYNSISKEYKGILIILDELDTISSNAKLAPFLKSFIEKLSTETENSIMTLITVSPLATEGLVKGHETILRSFTHLELKLLEANEVEELVNKALEIGIPKKSVSDDFNPNLAHFSSGIPNFVHELGRAAFDVDKDNILDEEDVIRGIIGTSEVVGAIQNLEMKHFRKRYTQDILSNRYRRILQAIASFPQDEVKLEHIRERLNEEDRKTLYQYVKNMGKRGVLTKIPGKKGFYSLPDRMFKIFLLLEQVRSEEFNRRRRSTKRKSNDEYDF